MAGPTKKPRKPTEPHPDEESMSDESESGTYHGQQEVQATFEGRNPEAHDFHGIKQLLNQLFLKSHIDLSQLTDMLIAQTGIGSVLKQSFNDSDDEEDADMTDESDVFGITSVINLSSHRETPCIQEFYNLLEDLSKKYATKETQDQITRILSQSKKLAFLLNERFVNIPAKISSVMLSSLNDEIQRKKKKDSSYDFDYYILICKTCKPKDEKDTEEIYSNDEEELFVKAADVNFDFCVEKESDTGLGGKWLSEDKQVVPYRKIIFFKAVKFENLIHEVKVLVE